MRILGWNLRLNFGRFGDFKIFWILGLNFGILGEIFRIFGQKLGNFGIFG